MSGFIRRLHYTGAVSDSALSRDINCCVCFDPCHTITAHSTGGKYSALHIDSHDKFNVSDFSEDELQQLYFYGQHVQSLTFLIGDGKDILVPDALFSDSTPEKFYEFVFGSTDGLHILHDHLEAQGIRLIYALPKATELLFQRLFPSATFKNRKTVLFEKIFIHRSDTPRVYIHTRSNSFDIFVFGISGFASQNTFYYNYATDYVYYVLSICKQNGLDPETLQLYLSGEIDREGAIFTFLHKYIRHIQFLEVSNIPSDLPEEIPSHILFNLPDPL